MQRACVRRSTGGKGNLGMFIERDSNVCAAGVPSAQPNLRLADCFNQYTLQDEVDSLISDAILPPPKPRLLPPLRRPKPLDSRYAGPFSEGSELINPPTKTKFQELVEDMKTTTYASYWRKPTGTIRDPVPMLPEGLDIYSTTFGKETPFFGRLYDIVMPSDTGPDTTPARRQAGYQTRRSYLKPGFNPDITFGKKSKGEVSMKCCLTDDRQTIGTALYSPINATQADFQHNQAHLGMPSTPNDNINVVPSGFAFGKLEPPDTATLPQCLANCDLNPERDFFLKCLANLNTLRKCLSKRLDAPFYAKLYLSLKYIDKCKTGWLPKEVIYDISATKYIRFNQTLLEPLLRMWNVFDGSQIEYKTFVHVLNHKEPLPELPKILDMGKEGLDFRTTYKEMVKPNKEADVRLLAGVPSGRYLDRDYPVTPNYCCRAVRSYLPQESDAKSCLCPSTLTLFGISHRDMYASRTPDVVRRVFEAAGGTFTDKKFDAVWEAAQKYHSQGFVCYETFKRALNVTKFNDENISST